MASNEEMLLKSPVGSLSISSGSLGAMFMSPDSGEFALLQEHGKEAPTSPPILVNIEELEEVATSSKPGKFDKSPTGSDSTSSALSAGSIGSSNSSLGSDVASSARSTSSTHSSSSPSVSSKNVNHSKEVKAPILVNIEDLELAIDTKPIESNKSPGVSDATSSTRSTGSAVSPASSDGSVVSSDNSSGGSDRSVGSTDSSGIGSPSGSNKKVDHGKEASVPLPVLVNVENLELATSTKPLESNKSPGGSDDSSARSGGYDADKSSVPSKGSTHSCSGPSNSNKVVDGSWIAKEIAAKKQLMEDNRASIEEKTMKLDEIRSTIEEKTTENLMLSIELMELLEAGKVAKEGMERENRELSAKDAEMRQKTKVLKSEFEEAWEGMERFRASFAQFGTWTNDDEEEEVDNGVQDK